MQENESIGIRFTRGEYKRLAETGKYLQQFIYTTGHCVSILSYNSITWRSPSADLKTDDRVFLAVVISLIEHPE